MGKKIKNYLLDYNYISNINVKSNCNYNNKNYDFLIYCNIEAESIFYPIIIGIPKNWELYLFDIYLAIKKVINIPHIDQNHKFCLYDLDSCIIDNNFFGLLIQCIGQARILIKNGVNKKNQTDFLDEFNLYINCLKNVKQLKIIIPKKKINKKIYYHSEKSNEKKKNGEKFCEFKKRTKVTEYFASCKEDDFINWGKRGTVSYGMYFYINSKKIIYPPNISSCVDCE